jgi:hypothetical protein
MPPFDDLRLPETVYTHHTTPDYESKVTPGHAKDTTLTVFFVPLLREWLYRQGARVEAVTDDELTRRTRHAFVDIPTPNQ